MNDKAAVQIELVPTNFRTRWPCTICGGCTEKVAVLAEGVLPNGAMGPDANPANPVAQIMRRMDAPQSLGTVIRVCETCLEAGNIDERLARHVDRLESEARELRALIGRLRVPSYEQWKNADRFYDHASFVWPIFVEHEQRGEPITQREQLIGCLKANDVEYLSDLADRYIDAWRTEWKAEWQAECKARDEHQATQRKIDAGELVRLVDGSVIEAAAFDPAVHTKEPDLPF